MADIPQVILGELIDPTSFGNAVVNRLNETALMQGGSFDYGPSYGNENGTGYGPNVVFPEAFRAGTLPYIVVSCQWSSADVNKNLSANVISTTETQFNCRMFVSGPSGGYNSNIDIRINWIAIGVRA